MKKHLCAVRHETLLQHTECHAVMAIECGVLWCLFITDADGGELTASVVAVEEV